MSNLPRADSGYIKNSKEHDYEENKNVRKNSITRKRRVRFNSFNNNLNNPLYKKEEKSTTLFRNYFDGSFDNFETENDNDSLTEDTITLHKNQNQINNDEYKESSAILNISQDKLLFNNPQYDSMFIHDIDPFKEKSFHNTTESINILDTLNEDEKETKKEIKLIYESDGKPPNYFDFNTKGKSKNVSVKFDENQLHHNQKNLKSHRTKKGKKNEKKKKNDTTRELLKNKFLKFVKKYASSSNNYSLSDDIEIEKSFYNFYDENFGKKDVDFDKNIYTYEKNDGSKFDITINDLFDDQDEFDEFKNSIYINDNDNDNFDSLKSGESSSTYTSFQYNPSFIYDRSFSPEYEDTMNYLCYNISTCIDNNAFIDDEETNRKKNENILIGLFDEEEEEKEVKDDGVKEEISKPETKSENSKLKENLKSFMESEAFKKVLNNPETLTIFLKGILSGYVDPKKIDNTKDKLFKMIDNKDIEQIKKFVNNYVDIIEESEDKIKDIKEKSIMIESGKKPGDVCTDVIESNPGFIARFNEIMIEKFTNINNTIINFTTELCPQIIKNGFNSVMKSIPFVVSFASLIPMEYVTGLLSSFPAGQAILATVNDIILKSTFLASSHMVLPQIAVIIGFLYKYFSNRDNGDQARGINNDGSNNSLTKFMGIFEIFSNNLRSDGGLSNTERDPSVITSKIINAVFKTMMESKDLPNAFHNEKINSIMTSLMNNLPNSDNKIKACLAILNDVMNKDNDTCKELFDELINLLDREKLSNEDFNKILSLIIKGSENLQISSNIIEKKEDIEINQNIGDNDYDHSMDKSYSVIVLSQVLDELKKSKDSSDTKNEKGINLYSSGNELKKEKIIREYSINTNSKDSYRTVKMKNGYSKRSYSLDDFENKKKQSEFGIIKQDSKNKNTQFSIKRTSQYNPTEEIIPKYSASTSTSPATSPISFQRKYNSNNEKKMSKYQLKKGYSDGEILSPERLFKMEKNYTFNNLNIKNEWSDEVRDKNNKRIQENMYLQNKGLNIGDSLINDEVFTPYIITDNIKKELESNIDYISKKYLINNSEKEETTQSSKKSNSEYSINSDDTYDKLYLMDSKKVNSPEDSIKVKQSKKSFKQIVMDHFIRNTSKKSDSKYQYIEWENLPLEIIFNIFSEFSIEELAYLRGVSKYFNYILTNPVFYMNINLTSESDIVDNKALLYQWKLSNGYLLSLNLSQCTLINESVFKDALDYKIQDRRINDESITNEKANLCFNNTKNKFEKEESLVQNLRFLDISYCSGIYSSQTMCNFFRGISIQPDGNIIEKNGCINLEELILSDLYQILDDDLLISIADSCPNLKKLYISKGYDITNFSVKMILQKCKHLESLKIVNCPKINYEAFDTRRFEEASIMNDNMSYDLNLKYINVNYCRMMEDNLVEMISNYCPYLEELYISGCQNLSNKSMKNLVSGRAWKNKKVKVLDISGCYCIGDNGIKTITPSVLEKLNISDCSFITDTGLNYIFEGMPYLNEVGYENCSGTSSVGRDKLQTKYQVLSISE
ncbi:RNI-like protein [Piromyces finnis]|uniref:RNI-like protein n=1 Tax=Piromyces finnis TaxID=1754191 RepID=A0A1Y1VL16_9FUNG|nr:RNI-like protein [Piromyces finnis]|eukprot:ORX58459.1 RNI-like protein [Piromyces finnis]